MTKLLLLILITLAMLNSTIYSENHSKIFDWGKPNRLINELTAKLDSSTFKKDSLILDYIDNYQKFEWEFNGVLYNQKNSEVLIESLNAAAYSTNKSSPHVSKEAKLLMKQAKENGLSICPVSSEVYI